MPVVHNNPALLATIQAKRLALVPQIAKRLHTRLTLHMLRHGAELTAGSITTAELRAAGHPFARRKLSRRGFLRERVGRGQRLVSRHSFGQSFPLLPINRQSGKLQRSLSVRVNRATATEQDIAFHATAPYAKYILAPGGTRLMVARGFRQEMNRRFRYENTHFYHDFNLALLALHRS